MYVRPAYGYAWLIPNRTCTRNGTKANDGPVGQYGPWDWKMNGLYLDHYINLRPCCLFIDDVMLHWIATETLSSRLAVI